MLLYFILYRVVGTSGKGVILSEKEVENIE